MPDFIYLKPKCCSTCKHDEDVCQHCLEKVQTEEAPQISTAKKSPPGRTIAEKRNTILFGSSFLGLAGYVAFQNGKLLLELFDFSVDIAKGILKAIMAPTRKE